MFFNFFYNNRIHEDRQVIESKIDSQEWILECERVATRLKYQVKNDSKEWRSNLEKINNNSSLLKKNIPIARDKLEKLTDELNQVLDNVAKKEKTSIIT